jgi:alkylation response protein AidB-like acyl-CoA dehydrogenase
MSTQLSILTSDWWQLVFHDWLKVLGVPRSKSFAHVDQQTFQQAIELAEQIGVQKLAPFARLLDRESPSIIEGQVRTPEPLKAALAAIADAGFFAASAPISDGGAQLPAVLNAALNATFSSYDATVYGYCALTQGAANLLRSFGTAEQKSRYLAALDQGRYFGTMCLSEAHAGSSVGDIRTRATLLGDGRYQIRGSKMWISGCAHALSDNIIHMVLARIDGAPAGTKGLSLFIVPRDQIDADGKVISNGVGLVGLNHKMGYRGTVNGALSFGDLETCVGELLGAEHQGMACMFQMMNEARIAVGIGAAAIAARGVEIAFDYAGERQQGRSLKNADPKTPMVPIRSHPDVKRMLLKAAAFAEGGLLLCLYAANLVDSADADAQKLLGLLTPMVKSWPAKYGLEANDLSIQVLGGAGYTEDWLVEKLYRDNRLNPIHEGTHGIQGMDLLARKLLADQGQGLVLLLTKIASTAQMAVKIPELADIAPASLEMGSALAQAILPLAAHLQRGEAELAFVNASLILDALGTVIVCWLTLDFAMAAIVAKSPIVKACVSRTRYLHHYELPAVQTVIALLQRADRTVLDATW